MKTQTYIPDISLNLREASKPVLVMPVNALNTTLVVLAALLPLLLLSTVSLWAIATGGTEYLAATWWGTGFLFFTLALDSHGRKVAAYLLTGIAIIGLSLLGSRVSGNFLLLPALLISGWLAIPALKTVADSYRLAHSV